MCGPIRRWNSWAGTSTSARAAITATRRWSARCVTRWSATATTRWPPRACTTTPSKLGFLEFSFVETVEAMHISYIIRAVGGLLYLSGAIIMAYNMYRTIKGDVKEEDENVVPQPAAVPAE